MNPSQNFFQKVIKLHLPEAIFQHEQQQHKIQKEIKMDSILKKQRKSTQNNIYTQIVENEQQTDNQSFISQYIQKQEEKSLQTKSQIIYDSPKRKKKFYRITLSNTLRKKLPYYDYHTQSYISKSINKAQQKILSQNVAKINIELQDTINV